MSTNVYANNPTVVVAKLNKTFSEIGLNTINTTVVYEINGDLKSWRPDRTINPIFGVSKDKGYYIITKVDMDLTDFFVPPTDNTSLGIAGGDLSGYYPNPSVHWINGYTTYDGRYVSKTGSYSNPSWLTSLAASKISGLLDISNIPAAALERIYIYSGIETLPENAGLTNSIVQNGDVVKILSTGIMYAVVNDTALSNSTSFTPYNAGAAATVPWGGITSKPTTISGYNISDAYTKTDIDEFLANYVTRTTTQTITGEKTFTRDITAAGIVPEFITIVGSGNITASNSGGIILNTLGVGNVILKGDNTAGVGLDGGDYIFKTNMDYYGNVITDAYLTNGNAVANFNILSYNGEDVASKDWVTNSISSLMFDADFNTAAIQGNPIAVESWVEGNFVSLDGATQTISGDKYFYGSLIMANGSLVLRNGSQDGTSQVTYTGAPDNYGIIEFTGVQDATTETVAYQSWIYNIINDGSMYADFFTLKIQGDNVATQNWVTDGLLSNTWQADFNSLSLQGNGVATEDYVDNRGFVETGGSYSNPSWITSLAFSKITGTVPVTQGGTGQTTLGGVQTWLGLGSNAYTSTAYLPTAGGTMTGALSGTSATFSGQVIAGGVKVDDGTNGVYQFGSNGKLLYTPVTTSNTNLYFRYNGTDDATILNSVNYPSYSTFNGDIKGRDIIVSRGSGVGGMFVSNSIGGATGDIYLYFDGTTWKVGGGDAGYAVLLHAQNIGSYALPLAGGTLTGALSGTSATFNNDGYFGGAVQSNTLKNSAGTTQLAFNPSTNYITTYGNGLWSNNLIVGETLESRGIFYHRSNLNVLNKAVDGWLTWASRNTAGSETVINLNNIGSINVNSYIATNTNNKVVLDSEGDNWSYVMSSNGSGDVPVSGLILSSNNSTTHVWSAEDNDYGTIKAGAFIMNAGTAAQVIKGNGSISTHAELIVPAVRVNDANYTATVQNELIEFHSLTAVKDLTLPNPASMNGKRIVVMLTGGNYHVDYVGDFVPYDLTGYDITECPSATSHTLYSNGGTWLLTAVYSNSL